MEAAFLTEFTSNSDGTASSSPETHGHTAGTLQATRRLSKEEESDVFLEELLDHYVLSGNEGPHPTHGYHKQLKHVHVRTQHVSQANDLDTSL